MQNNTRAIFAATDNNKKKGDTPGSQLPGKVKRRVFGPNSGTLQLRGARSMSEEVLSLPLAPRRALLPTRSFFLFSFYLPLSLSLYFSSDLLSFSISLTDAPARLSNFSSGAGDFRVFIFLRPGTIAMGVLSLRGNDSLFSIRPGDQLF